MKVIFHFLRSPRRMLRIGQQRNRQRIKRDLFKIKQVFAQEREDTQLMLQIYRKFTLGEASQEEMKLANRQLADLLKGLGIGVFAILPFSPLTIPAIIIVSRRLGVNILPSAFYQQNGKALDKSHKP